MMGIMVPETCWASNKICNKNHLLHLVGVLFPHINDDARSKPHQICLWYFADSQCVHSDVSWLGCYVHTRLQHVTSGPTSTFTSADKLVTFFATRQVALQTLIYTWALRAPRAYSSQHLLSRSNSPLFTFKVHIAVEVTVKYRWSVLSVYWDNYGTVNTESVGYTAACTAICLTRDRIADHNVYQTSGASNICVDVWRTLGRFVTVTINSE